MQHNADIGLFTEPSKFNALNPLPALQEKAGPATGEGNGIDSKVINFGISEQDIILKSAVGQV